MSANNRHAEQSAEGVNTFDSARQPEKRANPLQGMFTDLDRVDFDIDPRLMKEKGETVSLPIPSLSDTDTSYGDLPDESMDSEEMERFADASPEAWDCGHGIGAQEMDWIIDLCSGRAVPPDKRQAVVKAIHALRNTAIQKALLSGINDSDARITRFLDEAEEEADQTTTSDA